MRLAIAPQKAHWLTTHKQDCIPLAALLAAEAGAS